MSFEFLTSHSSPPVEEKKGADTWEILMARDVLLLNRNAKTNILNGPIHYTIAQSLTPPSITRKTRGKQCNVTP